LLDAATPSGEVRGLLQVPIQREDRIVVRLWVSVDFLPILEQRILGKLRDPSDGLAPTAPECVLQELLRWQVDLALLIQNLSQDKP
jgi:hypothetical protein